MGVTLEVNDELINHGAGNAIHAKRLESGDLSINANRYDKIEFKLSGEETLSELMTDRDSHSLSLVVESGSLLIYKHLIDSSKQPGSEKVTLNPGNKLELELDEHGRWYNIKGNRSPLSYSNSTRPPASNFEPGTAIWNTDDGALNYSDGSKWRDTLGTIT